MTTSIAAEASQTQNPAVAASAATGSKDSGGLSFHDLLEVINPLQHIPVISTVYRELTGDTISPAARIAGDGLYGGLIGLATSVVNEVVEGTTGKDIGGHIWATLFGDDDDNAAPTATAAATAIPASSETATATGAGAPTSLLPPTTSTVAPAAPAASPTAAATGPVTPLNGPTSFFQTMQRGGHSAHAVPLTAAVPGNDPHRAGAQALLNAQTQQNNPQNAAQGAQAPTPGLGSTGIAAGTSTPPPAIPAAPPLSPPPAAAPPLPGNITDLMMKGLDQYKAMALQQNGTPAPAATPSTGVPATALID